MYLRPAQSAFSLVELSIVLVILGLLTGGILGGQALIRAAELRAASTEYQRYTAAIHTLRDKYFAAPGDFSGATRFWGRQTATADCLTNATPAALVAAPGTCDGNGNGNIDVNPPAVSQAGELFQFWRHLALAGLIEGTYTGSASAVGIVDMVPGVNVPRSRVNNGAWGIGFHPNYGGDGSTYAIDFGNYFVFGGAQTNAPPQAPMLKPEEAWNLDTKLDDGRPAAGKIIARYWNNACASADDGSSANNDFAASYRLGDSSLQCSLMIPRLF